MCYDIEESGNQYQQLIKYLAALFYFIGKYCSYFIIMHDFLLNNNITYKQEYGTSEQSSGSQSTIDNDKVILTYIMVSIACLGMMITDYVRFIANKDDLSQVDDLSKDFLTVKNFFKLVLIVCSTNTWINDNMERFLHAETLFWVNFVISLFMLGTNAIVEIILIKPPIIENNGLIEFKSITLTVCTTLAKIFIYDTASHKALHGLFPEIPLSLTIDFHMKILPFALFDFSLLILKFHYSYQTLKCKLNENPPNRNRQYVRPLLADTPPREDCIKKLKFYDVLLWCTSLGLSTIHGACLLFIVELILKQLPHLTPMGENTRIISTIGLSACSIYPAYKTLQAKKDHASQLSAHTP